MLERKGQCLRRWSREETWLQKYVIHKVSGYHSSFIGTDNNCKTDKNNIHHDSILSNDVLNSKSD